MLFKLFVAPLLVSAAFCGLVPLSQGHEFLMLAELVAAMAACLVAAFGALIYTVESL